MKGREGTGASQKDPDVCVCVCVEERGSEECGIKEGQEIL